MRDFYYYDTDNDNFGRESIARAVNSLAEMVSLLEAVSSEQYMELYDFTIEQLQLLYEHHSDLMDKHKHTLLKYCRRKPGIEFLLSIGATLDNAFQSRYSYNVKLVQLLEYHGISLFGPYDLSRIVTSIGFEDIMEYLMLTGIFSDIINWQDPTSGNTILHMYCWYTNFNDELVFKCIQHGFDITLRNKRGELFYKIPHLEIVKLLL